MLIWYNPQLVHYWDIVIKHIYDSCLIWYNLKLANVQNKPGYLFPWLSSQIWMEKYLRQSTWNTQKTCIRLQLFIFGYIHKVIWFYRLCASWFLFNISPYKTMLGVIGTSWWYMYMPKKILITRYQACWRRLFDWLLKGHMNVTSYGVIFKSVHVQPTYLYIRFWQSQLNDLYTM